MRRVTWLLVLTLTMQIASCIVVSPALVLYPAGAVIVACDGWAEPDVDTRHTLWCTDASQGDYDPTTLTLIAALVVLVVSLVAWIVPTAMLSARLTRR